MTQRRPLIMSAGDLAELPDGLTVADRTPVVLIDGDLRELPAGDSLIGAGSDGGVHGGALELAIRDGLGTTRIGIMESLASLLDASSVKFSSPDSLAALVDLVQLIYRDVQIIGSTVESDILFISSIADPLGVLSDAYRLALNVLTAEANGAHVETLMPFLVTMYEAQAASEVHKLSLAVPGETISAADAYSAAVRLTTLEAHAALTEALLASARLSDVQGTQTDVESANVTSWGASQTTSGTAPTTPANAVGQKDGATAIVKAGGLANGTSTLTVTVPRANIPNVVGGAAGVDNVAYLRPNGDAYTVYYDGADGSGTGQQTWAPWSNSQPKQSGTAYDTIDDPVQQPTVPDLTDYVRSTNAGPNTALFDISTVAIPGDQAVTSVTVWAYFAYQNPDGSPSSLTVSLRKADGTVLATVTDSTPTTAGKWISATYTGALAQVDVDGLQIFLSSSLTLNTILLHAAYAELKYGRAAAGSRKIVAYYKTTAGTADSFTMTYSEPGGTPVSVALPSGDFLTVPYSVAVAPGASDVTFTFTHTAPVPTTGGQIAVDAVGVITQGAF